MNLYMHGKLLLTAEYAVLDGTPALAIPTQLGQQFTFEKSDTPGIHWKAFRHDGSLWNETSFTLLEANKNPQSFKGRLQQLIAACIEINVSARELFENLRVISRLEFPTDYGLGSSSTLVAALAAYARVDAYQLLEKTFAGSGYDIACATASQPLIYTRYDVPRALSVPWNPDFLDEVFFVHLNQKQNSRDSIALYGKSRVTDEGKSRFRESITQLTQQFVACGQLAEFEKLMQEHERLIAAQIHLEPIQEKLFKDYPGAIKSLGGWGGDFIMATRREARQYFSSRGYTTIYCARELLRL